MTKDFSNIPLNISYDSGVDDVLWNFYIPVLSLANRYDRIAGFFSSSSLSLAARGMEDFIRNGGKMRLVTCPQLSAKDIEIIEKSQNDLDTVIADKFIRDYSEIETQFQRDHVNALGWMLLNGKLEIQIAVLKRNGHICGADEINASGIMHQKVGVMYDTAGNIISFSGSNNESASGWLGNTEEFKVFCSWKGAMPYIEDDIKKFNGFWNSTRPDVEMKTLPKAIEEHLLKASKDFEPSFLSAKKYYPDRIIKEKQPKRAFDEGNLKEDVYLQYRIIETDDIDLRAKITEYLNSQTQIKDSYFLANNVFVRELQTKLMEKGYFLERLANEFDYKHKLGKVSDYDKNHIFTLEKAVQVCAAFYFNEYAARAKRGKNELFDKTIIDEIVPALNAEKVIHANEVYQTLYSAITLYRKCRRSPQNKGFLEFLGVHVDDDSIEETMNQYSFMNTADLLLLNTCANLERVKSTSGVDNVVRGIELIKEAHMRHSEMMGFQITRSNLIFTEIQELIENSRAEEKND